MSLYDLLLSLMFVFYAAFASGLAISQFQLSLILALSSLGTLASIYAAVFVEKRLAFDATSVSLFSGLLTGLFGVLVWATDLFAFSAALTAVYCAAMLFVCNTFLVIGKSALFGIVRERIRGQSAAAQQQAQHAHPAAPLGVRRRLAPVVVPGVVPREAADARAAHEGDEQPWSCQELAWYWSGRHL